MDDPGETTVAAELATDAKGTPTLFLRGAWTAHTEAALRRDDWQALAVFGVDWPDYRVLQPYAAKIRRLRVPFGPDSSAGLTDLQELTALEMTDALSPPVDFRKLARLRWLETLWDKPVDFLAHPALETLVLHRIGGADLSWIPPRLLTLVLKGGPLKSLAGIAAAIALEELRAEELKRCGDIDDVTALTALRVLELDAPKAALASVDWVATMPRLHRLQLTSPAARIDWRALGAHPTLQSIAITAAEGYDLSDASIEQQVRAGGREFLGLRRFPGRQPAFAVELGT